MYSYHVLTDNYAAVRSQLYVCHKLDLCVVRHDAARIRCLLIAA